MPRQYSKSTKFKTFFWHPLAATAVFFNNLFLVIGPFCSLSLRTFNLRWMGPWMWCETALGPCAWVRHTWEPRPGRWKGSGKDLSNPWVNETEHIATVGLKIEHPWHVLFYSKGPKFVGLIFDLWMHIPISVTCQQLSGGPMEHLNPRNSNSSDGIRRFWSFCFCQVLWGPFPGLLAKLPVSLLVRLLEQDALNVPEDATLTAILKGGGLGVEICRCFTCIYIYIYTFNFIYWICKYEYIVIYCIYIFFTSTFDHFGWCGVGPGIPQPGGKRSAFCQGPRLVSLPSWLMILSWWNCWWMWFLWIHMDPYASSPSTIIHTWLPSKTRATWWWTVQRWFLSAIPGASAGTARPVAALAAWGETADA